ncbi:P-loop containing nucleoside triphosphate hydrolase protein [Mycena epipterygia]|nr:P-loop containing nucleoside triphosphate hydrolase protein [Mycena epipterygia]
MCWLQKCSFRGVNPQLLRHFSSSQAAYSKSFEAHAENVHNLDPGLETHPRIGTGPRVKSKSSFGALGLHPPIVSALRTAFPNIKHPTKIQAVLIPAVLDGRDIFLQDQTGSGKSFGLVLALLNRPRVEKRKSEKITSIFIVPHRDLAYQCLRWVERMFAPAASVPSASISSIAQVLVRDNRGSSLSLLRENPPHLLFGTPQALMDVWREQPDALQLKTLSAIVVDEADYLVPTVDYSTSRKRVLKQQQHPGDTREFLDIIYGKNMGPLDDEYSPHERASPQLIISSATLPPHLVEYVSEESAWLNRDNWVSISGASAEVLAGQQQPKSQVTHSVLVVDEDHVRNIAGALPSGPSSNNFLAADADEGTDDPVAEIDPALVQKYMQTASPFNPLALETIAMIFATDVPSTALLVIPATSPVQRAIFELRRVGVNAHELDLLKNRPSGRGADVRANPTLLVSTWANTRGVDVHELSHVFVLGIPHDGATAYVHIAGRVGRLESTERRRKGKVVMVVGPSDEDAARRLLRSIECEAVELRVEM